MTLANASATLGTGDIIATHTAGGKEHQVVMIADDSGDLLSTKAAYTLWVPGQAAAASKLYFDLWNGTTSNVIEVTGVWAIPKSDASVTPSVAIGVGLFRTSTIGSSAIATAGYNTGSSTANPVITPFDTNNLNASTAGVSARQGPTAGATISAPFWENYVFAEETNVAAYLSALVNLLPAIPDAQPLTLRPSQGLLAKENATASPIGTLAFLVHFKVF